MEDGESSVLAGGVPLVRQYSFYGTRRMEKQDKSVVGFRDERVRRAYGGQYNTSKPTITK